MFESLLLKFANNIINKYGIHILDTNSIIQIYDTRFRIQSYNYSKNLNDYSRLNLEGVDIIADMQNIKWG